MADTNDKRGSQHFRIEVIRESLLQKDRDALADEDLVITFSELPDNLTLQKSATYNDEVIAGRSEPWKTYSSSPSTLIDFQAKLVAMGTEITPGIVDRAFAAAGSVGNQLANKFGFGAELGIFNTFAPRVAKVINVLGGFDDEKGITTAVFEEVHKKAAFLESLVYPQYNEDGLAFPPPLINLIYGANFIRRGIIKDVRLQYKKPWVPESGLAMVIDCNIVMEEVNSIPKSHLQVRNFQNPLDGAAGQATSAVPFTERIEKLVRARFGL